MKKKKPFGRIGDEFAMSDFEIGSEIHPLTSRFDRHAVSDKKQKSETKTEDNSQKA